MPHTLHTLPVALRGMPREAPILVETPDGLRRVSLVSATYVRDDGGRLEGGPKGDTGRYAIVLHLERRDGTGFPLINCHLVGDRIDPCNHLHEWKYRSAR